MPDTAVAEFDPTKPIPIGDRNFFRRRRNWSVNQQTRRLRRVQDRLLATAAKAEGDLDDLDVDTPQAEWDEQEKTTAEAVDAAEQSIYDIFGHLLTAEEDSDKPLIKADVEFCKKQLDVTEVVNLTKLLLFDEETDPTKASPTASA